MTSVLSSHKMAIILQETADPSVTEQIWCVSMCEVTLRVVVYVKQGVKRDRSMRPARYLWAVCAAHSCFCLSDCMLFL